MSNCSQSDMADLRLGKVNYSDAAYEYILKGILSERLRPGDPLRPESIAATVSLSPTPIKQALARLAGEGLVDLRPGQCPRVSSPTRDEILEMYEIRSLFESQAVLRGIDRVDDRFLARLDALLKSFEEAIAIRAADYESRRRSADLDIEIHHHIMSLWPNSRIQGWYRQLNVLLRPFNLTSTTEADMERSVHAHQSIRDALVAGDAAAASDTLRHHIAGSAHTFLKSLGDEQVKEVSPAFSK